MTHDVNKHLFMCLRLFTYLFGEMLINIFAPLIDWEVYLFTEL